MAKPAFQAGFTLPQGATIFMVGSCFARTVEKALVDKGFRLPALELLKTEEDFEQPLKHSDYCVDPMIAAALDECSFAAGRLDIAETVLPLAAETTNDRARETPRWPTPLKVIANTLATAGDPRAVEWYDRAVMVSDANFGIVLEMADFLVRIGDKAAAQDRLASVDPATNQEQRRKDTLLRAI